VYVPSPATVNVFDAYCSRSKSTVATPIVPSASVSFVVTFIVTGVSSSVAAESFNATGGCYQLEW
jgi:putative effector of murein hydrolase LrgA (UPF0299 family)